MTTDPYQTLGVARTASAAEIKSAYRKLAKKFHPDANAGNKAAETKFKEVSGAFDILGDTKKKARFDRGEIDADGNERAAAYAGGGHRGAAGAHYRGGPSGRTSGDAYDIGDIFSDLFGGMGGQGRGGPTPARGRDVRYRLEVDFLEAARGVKKRVTMPDGRTLDLAIPQGLRDNQALRLRGKGEEGRYGGGAGDVYVDVSVRAHPHFKVEGDTVILDVPVSLREAVLGEKITVPTIEGDVTVKLPENASSGTALRLKGKGLTNRKTQQSGDQITRIRIVLPKQVDPALKTLLEGQEDQIGEVERGKIIS